MKSIVMKQIILSLLVLFASAFLADAQNVAINSTGNSADGSAMLDISSTTSGLLIPRLTTTEQDAIGSPSNGLLIFNTTLNTIMMNTGNSLSPVWTPILSGTISSTAPITYSAGVIGISQSSSSTDGYLNSTDWNTFNGKLDTTTGWRTTGNRNTTPGTNFLGTIDNKNLVFKTNNTQAMILDASGNVGIGTSPSFQSGSEAELFLVDGGNSTGTHTLMNAIGTKNDYLQINVQNNSNGGKASSDVVATANNGTLSTVYIDMGINSQGYSNGASNILNGSNVAYLYATGTDFYIGNGATGKDLIFFVNSSGTTGPDGTEIARFTSTALVPGTTNSFELGTSTKRWKNIYLNNAPVVLSDRRMKTNISELGYGLKAILSLKPVSYNWKTEPNTNLQLGLIAQEVREVVPEVVKGNEQQGTIGMNYTELIPVLIKAIQEQEDKIDNLTSQIEELKGLSKEGL